MGIHKYQTSVDVEGLVGKSRDGTDMVTMASQNINNRVVRRLPLVSWWAAAAVTTVAAAANSLEIIERLLFPIVLRLSPCCLNEHLFWYISKKFSV
jgi:hypothetical protein